MTQGPSHNEDLAHRFLGVAPGQSDAAICQRSAGKLRRALLSAYALGQMDGRQEAGAPAAPRPSAEEWDMAKDRWLLPGVVRK